MKTFKRVMSVMLIAVMMLSLAGCVMFGKCTEKKFIKALEDVAKLDDDEYTELEDDDLDYYYNSSDDCEYCVYGYDGDCYYDYMTFEDADAARDYFEDHYYDDAQDMFEDDDFDGSHRIGSSGNSAYILLNGDSDSDDFYDGDLYGGFFLKDDTIVIVLAFSDSKSDVNDIKDFLSAIGYPKP